MLCSQKAEPAGDIVTIKPLQTRNARCRVRTPRPLLAIAFVPVLLTVLFFALAWKPERWISLRFVSPVLPVHAAIVAGTERFSLGLGAPTLLSGPLGACSSGIDANTCVGGLATLVAFGRHMKETNVSNYVEIIPELDTTAPFVFMHPDGLAVNMDVYKAANIHAYFALPSFYSRAIDFDPFFAQDSPRAIATNMMFPLSSPWILFTNPYKIFTLEERDPGASRIKVAVLRCLQMGQTWVGNTTDALATAIRSLRVQMSVDVIVVISGDYNFKHTSILPALGSYAPDVFIDLTGADTATSFDLFTVGRREVWVSHYASSHRGLFVNLDIDMETRRLAQVTFSFPSISTALPPALRNEPEYRNLQSYLIEQASIASVHNPVLTTTLEDMPKSRVDQQYPCFSGECAQGNIYTGAYYWRYQVDVAFTNAGGPRGPGIPAGNVRISDVWSLMSFENYPCTGTILGLKIWEMMNVSMSVATPGNHSYFALGSRVVLPYGLQIDYDNSTLANLAGTRIRAIRIYDRATRSFKLLERLRLYTFATDNYQCDTIEVYSTMIRTLYEGESVYSNVNFELIQTSIQLYLEAHRPYTPIFLNYLQHRKARSVSDFMVWRQTPAGCTDEERWYAPLATCQPCPQGYVHDSKDFALCVVRPPVEVASSSFVEVGVPIIILFGLGGSIAIVAFVLWKSRSKVRNTKFAPKGKHATIVFTDVQMSTKLWGTVPASMGAALDQHHTLIREAIVEQNAYEVKTIGDSFMIALKSPQQAAELAMQIQLKFQNAQWPRCIDEVYAAELGASERVDYIDDNPHDLVTQFTPLLADETVVSVSSNHVAAVSSGGADQPAKVVANPFEATLYTDGAHLQPHNFFSSFRSGTSPRVETPARSFVGIRVRIGIHSGPVDVVFDEVAKGYDYYGSAVNVAARLESAGEGGQIVLSREVSNALQADDSRFRIESLGFTELRGVSGKIEVLQLTPVPLMHRVFESRRLRKSIRNMASVADGDGEAADADSISTPTSRSERSNHLTPAELQIVQTLAMALRPLSAVSRQLHIAALEKAWRIDVPKRTSDSKREKTVLNVIAQRLAAVSNAVLTRHQNESAILSSTANGDFNANHYKTINAFAIGGHRQHLNLGAAVNLNSNPKNIVSSTQRAGPSFAREGLPHANDDASQSISSPESASPEAFAMNIDAHTPMQQRPHPPVTSQEAVILGKIDEEAGENVSEAGGNERRVMGLGKILVGARSTPLKLTSSPVTAHPAHLLLASPPFADRPPTAQAAVRPLPAPVAGISRLTSPAAAQGARNSEIDPHAERSASVLTSSPLQPRPSAPVSPFRTAAIHNYDLVAASAGRTSAFALSPTVSGFRKSHAVESENGMQQPKFIIPSSAGRRRI